MNHRLTNALIGLLALAAVAAGAGQRPAREVGALVGKFCTDCHSTDVAKGGLNLEKLLSGEVGQHSGEWEKVVRKLSARHMPPIGKPRPDEKTYTAAVASLEETLDRVATANPNPGRTDAVRRLNRTEYQNAIRDLLALDIDAAALLPADEASHGFDNVTVGTLSPTLLDRYITAAQKISRLAVGSAQRAPGGDTYRVKPDITQEERVDGLPFGTRGGALVRHVFPQDGDYEFQLRLARDRNDLVEGLRESHQILVLLDGVEKHAFTVTPPPARSGHNDVDTHLKVRLPVKAGMHAVGVTFLKNSASLLETARQPYHVSFNFHRHPRQSPALYQVSVTGPFDARGPGNTASRQRIFVTQPKAPGDDEPCAKQILSTLLRRAYRRPVSEADLVRPMEFYRAGAAALQQASPASLADRFDAGIEAALSAVLVSREFLFRVEQEPAGLASKTPYRISDLELASRLSSFLWSSFPDDELLDVAARGQLSKPDVLAQQTCRLLADSRSRSVVSNFASQWLQLRNLDSITPDGRIFPDFDDNLRQAMRRETELIFEEILHEDRSVLDLLRTDHTYLNERLAKHYGVPHVYGSRFRRVELAPETPRGGLLRHASVLTVTSYATRTSPVLRGNWILGTLLGTPPPPPPPNVPALADNAVSASLPVRERLAQHRANPVCASCHDLMDPVGLALENFDALGRWRMLEEGRPVDASGGFPDGGRFTGVAGLEQALLTRPELFVGTLTEKLLTFALGRGVETFDAPTVRHIVRQAQADNYRLSAIVLGIVNSTAFKMRQTL